MMSDLTAARSARVSRLGAGRLRLSWRSSRVGRRWPRCWRNWGPRRRRSTARRALVGFLLAGDTDRAAAALAGNAGLLDSIRRRHPSLILRAAVAGSVTGVELLAAMGFDIDARGRQDIPVEQEWETALHFAAGEGDLELVETLLRLGADPNVRDRRFDSTPLGWAEHLDHPEVAARLREITDEATATA